jgi:hypothetical protein
MSEIAWLRQLTFLTMIGSPNVDNAGSSHFCEPPLLLGSDE